MTLTWNRCGASKLYGVSQRERVEVKVSDEGIRYGPAQYRMLGDP
jgi:hypothetical protein